MRCPPLSFPSSSRCNDAERLQLCLRALDKQTYPKNFYEIIVVDNNSDEDVRPVVAKFQQTRVASESNHGSYAARNKGLSLARGEVIAFTDSDCIPAPDWIEKGVAHLLRSSCCGAVAGRIAIFFAEPDRPTAVELYESVMALTQKSYVERHKFGATANLFTTKSVFARVGMFDPDLRSGGDRNWGERVSAAGYELVYADDACVAHPARRSLGQLHKKTIRVIGGLHDLQAKKKKSHAATSAVAGKIIRGLASSLKFSGRALLDRRLRCVKDKLKVVGVVFFVRYVQVREEFRLRKKVMSNE